MIFICYNIFVEKIENFSVFLFSLAITIKNPKLGSDLVSFSLSMQQLTTTMKTTTD